YLTVSVIFPERKGVWVYELARRPPTPEQECVKWYYRNIDAYKRGLSLFRSSLPRCPCTFSGIWERTRTRWTFSRVKLSGAVCYVASPSSSFWFYPYNQECCYLFNNLIQTPPNAGSALAYNPVFTNLRPLHFIEDRKAHSDCCIESSSSYHCDLYYKLRPITGSCQRRTPFRRASCLGDPHITTLDERQYTFNGLGEYTLISIQTVNVTFTFQGRTGQVEMENGSLSKATVFTAFGLEENGTRVSVELDRITKTSMVIYGDGRDYTSEFNANTDFAKETTTFTLRRSDEGVDVAFPSGISITISIGMKSLDMSVTMPTEFQTQTKGLMGNFNDNKDDEFILPGGTPLGNNLTERQIYEDFGTKWAITADNSVMRYETRESTADFAHPEFVPIFLDEQPDDVKQEAETLCGGADKLACIYDFVATGNKAFAINTLRTDVTAAAERKELANNIPGLTAPLSVNVVAGEPKTFSVMGTDDEGDILTYKLFNASANQSINESNGAITATFDANDPRPINVSVTDSKGAQSIPVTIPVKLCRGCSNHGTCNYERTIRTGDSFDFAIATCDCAPAYTGSNCETELDACPAGNNPCPDGLDCVDLTPDEQGASLKGYRCNGTCPTGFIFDNDIEACFDINECANTSKCTNGGCVNTAGSYVCSCDAGYRLGSDGITCRDVNECAEKSSGCEQKCENEVGSFRCSCEPGNTLQAGNKSCTVDANIADECTAQNCIGAGKYCTGNTSTQVCLCKPGYTANESCGNVDECLEGVCDQDCQDSEGSFTCSCYPGFKLNADRRTCSQCTGLSYGANCGKTCECNGRGVACHHVTGCQCQSGWKGEACGDDVDECEENRDVCGQGQLCSNTAGSYLCSCLPGFSKDSAGTCQDVDECDETSGLNTCEETEVCNNFAGSFSCTCRNGYKRANGTCGDVDECKNNNGGCQQKCQNVVGSYNCECLFGYRLNPDRTSCTQVEDVCKEANLDCQHGCTLQDDDTAVCFCNSGYGLATDKQACQDIDECAASPKPCSDNCTNTVGSFSCSCRAGKRLDNDKLTCIDCPEGSYGDSCSRTCNCGIGSERCDAVTGCVCKSGWEGGTCERDVNECDVEATQTECGVNGSQCDNFQGGYRCQCDSGYKREGEGNCTDIDECANSPCSQTCENSPGSYRCLCEEGFTASGTDCNDIDECESTATNPCSQACDNQPGSYKCFCDKAGYQLNDDGITCSTQEVCTTNCDSTNGGCSKLGATENCFCNKGYELQDDNSCKFKDVDWCANIPCDQTCANTSDGRSFSCSCDAGYILNDDKKTCRACPGGKFGQNCTETCTCDTAKTVTCLSNNGTCQCKPGWKGPTCEVNVNECTDSSPCSSNAACTDTEGSFICKCNAGYSKNIIGVCEDIDECKQDDDDCGQICNNTPGTFTCDCNAGYTLNADTKTCDDIDECTLKTDDCGQICKNTPGTFTCDCNAGYKLNADNKACDDIDECKQDDDDCGQICNNTPGTFTCDCNAGYTLNADTKTCDDIDECTLKTDDCGQICKNTLGTFTCDCNAGYKLNADNKACDDIDECTQNTDGCGQICNNTPGTFTCDCNAGYTLNADNKTCDDIDECTLKTDDCGQICKNTPGTFTCDCNAGYKLNADNKACDDIDECTQNTDGCGQICNNTPGTFTCDCNAGYTLNADNKTCDDINECTDNNGGCGDKCNNNQGSFTCACKDGYKLKADNTTCEDIDECTDKTDGCQQVCNNTPGSFSCACNSGSTLTTDGKTCKESVSMRFTVRINITVSFDLSNETSSQYISLREELRQKMFDYLNATVGALIDVFVLNMREGSVVANMTAAVEKDTSEQSSSQLTTALRTLDREGIFTLNNQSGTANVTTTDGQSFSQVGVCEAFNAIHTCVNGSQCVEENGSASCTPAEPSDSDSDEWKIILGVCLGIPLAVIIAVNIFCLVRYKRRRTERARLEDHISESGSFPSMADLFGMPGVSMFAQADGKKTAWNYNESISSMPDLHRNDDQDRFGQFYQNLATDREFTIKRPQVDL
ncbi:fibrillin-2-like, partial [Littorina saxatilis]|uniref:fibrillin-2-like n=1 Tax=Littorina saxatilis TaxID=31220 RepID=UPI0038B455EE